MSTYASAARAPTPSPAVSRSPGPTSPTQWSNRFFEILFGYEWELTKSPAGAKQWVAKDAEDDHPRTPTTRLAEAQADDADHRPRRCASTRRTRRSRAASWRTPTSSALAFAKAWYKLLHRDMGPVSRFLGPWVAEPQLWQDPVPAVDHELVARRRRRRAQGHGAGLRPHHRPAGLDRVGLGRDASAPPTSAAAPTAPGSASSRSAAGRSTSPSSSRPCSRPSRASSATSTRPAAPRSRSPTSSCWPAPPRSRRRRRDAGRRGDRAVPRRSHRRHAGADRRRLVPGARAARRRLPQLPACRREDSSRRTLLVDRAYMLDLTAPEMTVLVGGLRALGANVGGAAARRPHRPAGRAQQRLLRQPALPGHPVEGVGARRTSTRSATSPPTRCGGPRPRST